MRKNIDVSVVLNMHREAPYLRPTLFSLDECAFEAMQCGLSVELVAVFDRPDQETLDVFHTTPLRGFSNVKTVEVDVGSLGLARNAGMDLAEGEFVWTADGDDLVSRNAIIELIKVARNHPNRDVVVFVEFLVAFGERFHVSRYIGSEWYTAADFAFKHSFVSRIFVRKSVFDAHRYLDLKVATGFAYEDWDFNGRLFAEGFDFKVAPGTVFFYRQRGNSLLRQANSVSSRLIPYSSLFQPEKYFLLMQSVRERNPDWSSFMKKRQNFLKNNSTQELLNSEAAVNYIAEAARLDPEVDAFRIETSEVYYPIPCESTHWGFQLEAFFALLGGRENFSDVVVLPWLKPGGAEKYILQIIGEIKKSDSGRAILVLSGESSSQHEWVCKLPPGSVFLDVFNAFPMLSDAERDALVVRGILSVAKKGALLHVKASLFSARLMDAYGAALASIFKVIYYRFCDDALVWRDRRVSSSWGIGFLRRHLSNIEFIVSDCRNISENDELYIGGISRKNRTIYSLCESRQFLNESRDAKYRLLWASRVCLQKKPEIVRLIAAALREKFPEIVIGVYGQLDFGYCADSLFSVPGVEYNGAFDGFDSLPLDQFDGFIYTSAFDGLPNIILESLAVGLPVIAPDVGGISEAVINGETGFLVENFLEEDALVAAYVEAVCALYDDFNMTKKMAENGQAMIGSRHGVAAFEKEVIDVFSLRVS